MLEKNREPAVTNSTEPNKPPFDPHQVIKDAKQLLLSCRESTVSKKTEDVYMQEVGRLLKKNKTDPWRPAAETGSSRSWFLRRAAILHVGSAKIRQLLAYDDKTQAGLRDLPKADPLWAEWQTVVKVIDFWVKVISRAPVGSPLIEKKPRQSKRRLGPGLPVDWREILVKRLPLWRAQYLVSAVAGCRPVELSKGVELRIENEMLIAVVAGAKLSDHSGQEWRELRWSLIGATSLVQQLISEIRAAGGVLVVNLGTRNKKPERAFSDAIKAAAKREWPNRKLSITAYSLRHAAASDLKRSGLNSSVISAALGHAAIATKSTYGHAAGARGASTAPSEVTAARPVTGAPTAFAPESKISSHLRHREGRI